MRVKTFIGLSEKRLDRRINEFISGLEENNFEVINIKFSSNIYGYSAMIIYKEL
ncbi:MULTISPECIES: sporulation protein Cse60 [Floricoccus]|uniref:sporulation protein Cse60 n=1 Tax=Floricoccus TaxID=1930830 RepID=UPI0009495CE4|nr:MULTISPECIES: sporulation protein Cse60 [Floricoccus]URZ88094.1 sporulation protein Cse60 [Floricoccus penangensis]